VVLGALERVQPRRAKGDMGMDDRHARDAVRDDEDVRFRPLLRAVCFQSLFSHVQHRPQP
jgi:hypothetical protein